ncbi:MAG: hypothetical protein WAM46_01160, partial [Flavobacterium sp.]
MKRTLLLISLLNITIFQAQTVQWHKALGSNGFEEAHCIQQTKDEGYIIAGYTTGYIGNHGNNDAYVVKLDAAGTIQWQKCLGGTENDNAQTIQQTSDGGYIISGDTRSNDGDVSGNHGGSDYWVIKLDATGAILWQKTYGGTSYDLAKSITQTFDGGFIVTGYTYSNDGDVSGNHGASDFWTVKLDASGTIQWQKCIGGNDEDLPSTIEQTTDGGYIIAGGSASKNGNVTGNHGGLDYWIVKLDATGTLQWQKSLGGTDDDYAESMNQTTDGGYIIAGHARSINGNVTGHHGVGNISSNDYWIVKLDGAGTIQWQKCYGGTGSDQAFSIQQTIDGGYIIAGDTTSSNDGDITGNHPSTDVWILKIDETGNKQWEKYLEGSSHDQAYSVNQTIDGGYVMTGITSSFDGHFTGYNGNFDAWIVKILPPVVLGINDTVKSQVL